MSGILISNCIACSGRVNKEKKEDLKSIGIFTEYETVGGNSL